ncbi:MAG: ATP synthase F0 subunit C [Desulfovibrio sp.]|jgi:F-type H+-transporting ATPase subunit c|nr:ATP synthase F0 subunit C [Mailhella sp.]
MRKVFLITLNTLVFLSVAAMAFAADGGMDAGFGLAAAGLAIGIGIAAAGGGCGQGMAIRAACEGTARNPDASGKISQSLILGLAFIESLVIYALLVCLILLFVKM